MEQKGTGAISEKAGARARRVRGWGFIVAYTAIAFVFAAFATRFQFLGFPDVALSCFAALSLAGSYTYSLAVGIILGVIAEGISPGVIWVTPALYVLLASSSFYATRQMNLRTWSLAAYLVIWSAMFKILPPVFHGYGLNLLDATVGTLSTAVLSYILLIPWTRGYLS